MIESGNKRVLVIAPHADDFEIGMGGTIAKLINIGYQVRAINLIIPCENWRGEISEESKRVRKLEAESASEILGLDMEILDLDPYTFNFSRELVKYFDTLIRDYDPGHIFMTWEYDSHQDHQVLAKIIYSATRKNKCSLYMYETMIPGGISNKAFKPQMFVDISDFIIQKRNSIEAYRSVFASNNLVDAIIGRAQHRGSQIGVKFAESFEVVKEIIF